MKNFKLSITGILCMIITLLSSCDNHVFEDETWHRWRPGMIYCTNGEINTYEEVLSKGNTPEAVIFYVDYDDKIDGTAYAVCIKNITLGLFLTRTRPMLSKAHPLIYLHLMVRKIPLQ